LNRYIEPFLGGGSCFFTLLPPRAALSDLNERLIGAYRAVRDEPAQVLTHLTRHAHVHDDDYYYRVRSLEFESEAERAAQFIYLNRTCWNGLYRVNLRGEFNVPRGTKDAVILQTDNFQAYAALLKDAEINCCDFEAAIDQATRGDFIFADPPYTVAHNNNGFIKYNQSIFSFYDQIRLRDCLVRAVARGATVLLTNAAHNSIVDLYEAHGTIRRLTRASVLAGSASHRSSTEELLVTMGY
jgi:DNA adenine methylase